jgi:hypothetical protein
MSTIPEKRNFVPYGYLSKGDNGTFHLFVLSPTTGDKKVDWNPAQYSNGATTVYGEVKADTGSSSQIFNRYKYYELTPASKAADGNYTFNESTFEVIITVAEENATEHRITLLYADADQAAPTTASLNDGIAYNSPYAHLTNPESDSSGNNKKYAPRCIIITNGYDQHSQKVSILSSQVGACAQEVVLLGSSSAISEIASGSLDANKSEYAENGPIDGYFHVQVLLAATTARANELSAGGEVINQATYAGGGGYSAANARSVIIRNKSSDTDDMVFIWE